jgi:hypothetical protein
MAQVQVSPIQGSALYFSPVDQQYRDAGWTKDQLGQTAIYSRPLPDYVLNRIAEMHEEQQQKSPLRRLGHEIGTLLSKLFD